MARMREGKFAPLSVKVFWTAVFFLCFMVGRNIPLHLLHDVAKGRNEANLDLLNAANVASGGNLFYPSLFSLGLGPWMGAAILWRFLFIGKLARDRRIPEQTVDRARNVLMLVLAVIQSLGLMSSYDVRGLHWGVFSDQVDSQIVIVVVLTAGAALVAWLAKQNEDRGLGGITMFILYQLIITAWRNRKVLSVATSDAHNMHVLWVVIVACACVVIVGVLAGNAETRLHVNKVAIDSGYTGMSYLPIKLNPAGASPIMYGLTLLALPQYVAHAVGTLVPGTSGGVDRFLGAWGLTRPAGFTVYLVLLFVLTIFFGLFSVGPKDTAERMRKAGEYFDHVAPGRATRRYLRGRVVLFSALSGLFLVIFTGLPLYFIGSYPRLQYLLLAPGTVMIVLGLLWLLQEEVADTLLGTKYDFSFRSSRSDDASQRNAPSRRMVA
jgi:preprotein translocase subunit SecY